MGANKSAQLDSLSRRALPSTDTERSPIRLERENVFIGRNGLAKQAEKRGQNGRKGEETVRALLTLDGPRLISCNGIFDDAL